MPTLLDRRNFVRFAVAMCVGFGLPRCAEAGRDDTAAVVLAAPIERRQVTSTSIAGVGYHAKLRVLEIEFHSGAIYRYVAVPPGVFEALMKADSKGRYFTQQIRNRFAYHRVGGPRP